jgi:hypothetical protein
VGLDEALHGERSFELKGWDFSLYFESVLKINTVILSEACTSEGSFYRLQNDRLEG